MDEEKIGIDAVDSESNQESIADNERRPRRVLKVRKKKKRTKKYYAVEGIRRIVMMVALFAFSYVSYELTSIYLDYKDADNVYADMNEVLNTGDDTVEEPETDESGSVISNKNKADDWEWDYDSYLRFNSDTKGFIMSEGTPIQYPIMQATDNNYYLTHLANNIESKNGSIFIDYKIDLGLEAKNCVIYGHNMRNDTMFGSLQEYAEESYYEKHPYMDVYVGYKHYRYYIFAMYTTPVNSDTYTIRFKNDKAFLEYIKLSKGKSIYTPDVGEITADDKIITLSTCMDSNDEEYRFIVQMVRREEVAD